MKINWSRLKKNIPNKVRCGPRSYFEVLWSEGLTDTQSNKLFGKTEFNPDKVIINTEQTDREAVLTFIHEYLHALDDKNTIGLTETQVQKLEKIYPLIHEIVMVLEGKFK